MKIDPKIVKIIICIAVVLILIVAIFFGVKMLGNKGPRNMPQGQGGPNMGQRPSGNNVPVEEGNQALPTEPISE